MRDLLNIIDQIIKVAPDLKDEFDSLISSTRYSAPEVMPSRWAQAAEILTSCASDHPKSAEIATIFSGK